MKTEIGMKFYPRDITEKLLKDIAGKVDFIELMAMERTGRKTFEAVSASGIPVIIHNMHLGQGVNLANTEREKKNLRSLRLAVEMADYFSSRIIVAHPGEKENPDCRVENSAWLFRRMADSRLLVESMPLINGPEFLCNRPEEVAAFMKLANCGFCLDIGHATAAAAGLGLDYIEHIKGFLALKPSYFHLQDTPLASSTDCHKHFGEGGMDLPRIFRMLPSGAMLCLETANDISGRFRDIEFLKENI